MSGDWAGRAGAVEEVIRRRFVRRLAGVVPGTRIGRCAGPARVNPPVAVALLVAGPPAGLPGRRPPPITPAVASARDRRAGPNGAAAQLRHLDQRLLRRLAWFGLAVQRAGPLARRSAPSALAAITTRLRADGTPAAGGGIWWRRGDDFKNAPANGPAAILAARTGDLEFATKITDWIPATLVDPQTGLVRDGVRLNPDGTIRTVEATTYTYCQGVYLGACVELAERDGHPRWAERAATVLNAITTMAGPDGVIPGFDDGGEAGCSTASWPATSPTPPSDAPSSPRSPPRWCWPAPTPPGRATPTWTTQTWTTPPAAARYSPPTGADLPAPPEQGFPKPTCRYNCRHGCSWKPPPEQPPPSPRRRPPIRPNTPLAAALLTAAPPPR